VTNDFPHALLEDAAELAGYRGWREEVYADFLAMQRDEMSEAEFRTKYEWDRAVLVVDMTGFTKTAIITGEIPALLRILNAQKVAIPVLRESGADVIRCFADDLVALFTDPHAALDAAFELHRRIELFNQSGLASDHPTECCIGIGFGRVLGIGPNMAQGDEMNEAAKLGEDIARANETLVTQRAYDALRDYPEVAFEEQTMDDQLFPFFRATRNP